MRLMFFDFSSAFNASAGAFNTKTFDSCTTQPHLPVQKLLNMKLPATVISWIFDYLTDCSMFG